MARRLLLERPERLFICQQQKLTVWLHCSVMYPTKGVSIWLTMNTYTHLGLDDAKNEMIRMEELNQARKEIDKTEGKKPMRQNMFKVV